VKEVLSSVRRVSGQPVAERIGPRRAGDPPVLIAAPDRIKAELGWQPRYTELDDIVATAWAWRSKFPDGFASKSVAA
jgi:UDP-glucose 4-epimerase